jgi:hypothetical protein
MLREVSVGATERSWNQELIAQALAALRIGGAVAAGKPFAQAQVAADAPAREGQLAVRQGILRRRRFLLSASVTPASFAEMSAAEELRALPDALTAFGEARYTQQEQIDSSELDRLLGDARNTLVRLRWRTRWPFRWVAALRPVASFRRSFAWTR